MIFYFRIDKLKALSLLVHCADIAHPAKPWSLHKEWSVMLCEEFFRQASLYCLDNSVEIKVLQYFLKFTLILGRSGERIGDADFTTL